MPSPLYTNFPRALPPPDSDMAEQILKYPYNFDFLTVTATAKEREIERGLLTHLRDRLLELGRAFSFVGSQVPVTVDVALHLNPGFAAGQSLYCS